MQGTSTGPATILQFRQDIEAQLRQQIREALEVALKEELAATLVSARHERTDPEVAAFPIRSVEVMARILRIQDVLVGPIHHRERLDEIASERCVTDPLVLDGVGVNPDSHSVAPASSRGIRE